MPGQDQGGPLAPRAACLSPAQRFVGFLQAGVGSTGGQRIEPGSSADWQSAATGTLWQGLAAICRQFHRSVRLFSGFRSDPAAIQRQSSEYQPLAADFSRIQRCLFSNSAAIQQQSSGYQPLAADFSRIQRCLFSNSAAIQQQSSGRRRTPAGSAGHLAASERVPASSTPASRPWHRPAGPRHPIATATYRAPTIRATHTHQPRAPWNPPSSHHAPRPVERP